MVTLTDGKRIDFAQYSLVHSQRYHLRRFPYFYSLLTEDNYLGFLSP